MGSFSYHVGQRIKKYRKSRGYTIEQFSAMINKSKATVSKYENGTITIDVETLYDVARALDIDLKCFIDYQPPVFHAQSVLPKNFYFNQPRAYMYYYDGRVRQLVRSLLCFSPSASGEGIDVMMYVGVDNFREPDRCQHLFTGEMKPYDTITHMVLTNQINEAEKMYICMLNPMHNRTPAVGLLSGIGSTPFFAPIALKTLISKEPLEENDRLLTSIKLDKDDRSGASANGENMDFFRPELIDFAVVFAFIYEGVPNWRSTNARVVLSQQGAPDIEVQIDNPNSNERFCVLASLTGRDGGLEVRREDLFFNSHRAVDAHYHFGFRWVAGHK